MTRKTVFYGFGFCGSWVIQQMGGWTIPLQLFFWCITVDVVSGYIVAGVFNNSPNTPNGKLSSRYMSIGIIKKFMYICIIILARQIDLVLGVNYIANGLIIGLIVTDLTSIIENAGLMGITLPKVFVNALELLDKSKEKGDKAI